MGCRSDRRFVQNLQRLPGILAPVLQRLLVGDIVLVLGPLAVLHQAVLAVLVGVELVVGVLVLVRRFRYVGLLHLIGPRLQAVRDLLQFLGRTGRVAEALLDVAGGVALLLSQVADLLGRRRQDVGHGVGGLGGLGVERFLSLIGDPCQLRRQAVVVLPDLPHRAGAAAD